MIGEFAALGAAICWTASAILYKKALVETKPLPVNTIRCLGAGLFLLFCLALIGFKTLAGISIHALLLASTSGLVGLGLGDTLYLLSLKKLGVSRAVPLTCTYPLFNIIWAVLLAKEEVTFQVVLAALTIVLGIWLLSYERGKGVENERKDSLIKGIVIALATAVIWSISIFMVNLALQEAPDLEHAFAINTLRVISIAAVLLVIAPITHRGLGFFKIKRKVLAMILSGGIIALGIGWFFLILSFAYIPESQAVPISSTTPLFSTLLGAIFLHEKVTASVGLGSVMVVAGTVLIFII
jgi:DME family drug/metabolite transporter